MRLKFVILLSLLVFLGCSQGGLENNLGEEEQEFISYGVKGGLFQVDSNWLFKESKFTNSDTVLWYPLANSELEMIGPCDSCHGASANYFEFEHLTWMRDSLKTIFPSGLVLEELTPGLFNLQEEHPIDSIHGELMKSLEDGELSFKQLDSRAPFHDFWNSGFPIKLQEMLLSIKSDMRGDYLLLPLNTKVTLFPEGNEPQGRIEIKHHWILVDFKNDKILMSYYTHLKWHSGSKNIDRETSQLIFNPMSRLLWGVQYSIPNWAH